MAKFVQVWTILSDAEIKTLETEGVVRISFQGITVLFKKKPQLHPQGGVIIPKKKEAV